MRTEDKVLCRYFVCLNIKSQTTTLSTRACRNFWGNKMKKVNQSFAYNACPVGLWCLITFPTVLKSVLACIEVVSESATHSVWTLGVVVNRIFSLNPMSSPCFIINWCPYFVCKLRPSVFEDVYWRLVNTNHFVHYFWNELRTKCLW